MCASAEGEAYERVGPDGVWIALAHARAGASANASREREVPQGKLPVGGNARTEKEKVIPPNTHLSILG